MPHAATTDVDLGQRPVRLAERDGLHRGFWQTSYEAALAWAMEPVPVLFLGRWIPIIPWKIWNTVLEHGELRSASTRVAGQNW